MDKKNLLIVGIVGTALIGISIYLILRHSKNTPISNIPTVTYSETKEGLDWQGIGAGLGGFFNPIKK